MELTTRKRKAEQKKEAKRLVREGCIPAVVYGKEGKPTTISVSSAEFAAAIREIKAGCLPTTRFSLKGEGCQGEAVVKDIQYARTTYEVIHLDFQQIEKDTPVSVSVPIHCIGMADCPGIKTGGGVLRQVIRTLPMRGPATQIPSEVIVDVSELEMGQTRRLRDIALPAGVEPRAKMDEVVAVIAKR